MKVRNHSFTSLTSAIGNDDDLTSYYPYPFTRQEECSWHPEEAGRKLSQLIHFASNGSYSTYWDQESSRGSLQHLITRGWSTEQARFLRSKWGKNTLRGKDEDDRNSQHRICRYIHRIAPWFLPIVSGFLSQFNEPLNIMLLISAAISLMLKQTSDAISIGLALTIVSLVAAIQEYRSEAALEKLNDLVPHTCTVLRDGAVRDQYPAKHLVVGDLIVLSTGDRVPADCRLIDTVELTVDESSLTGENISISKIGDAVCFPQESKDPPLTEQRNIAFMGSLVCSGRGRAFVIAVGNRTEFGKVANELGKVESRKSPLQTKIDELGKTLAYISSIVIGIMAILGWIMGRPFLETLTVAVSLAVAAIPEGKLFICVFNF